MRRDDNEPLLAGMVAGFMLGLAFAAVIIVITGIYAGC